MSISATTWNTLGLGVASTFTALGLAATFLPGYTATIFGFEEQHATATATATARKTSESIISASALIMSRDLSIGLALFTFGRARKNDEMGVLILSIFPICVADGYLFWRQNNRTGVALVAVGASIWGLIGLGLRGYLN